MRSRAKAWVWHSARPWYWRSVWSLEIWRDTRGTSATSSAASADGAVDAFAGWTTEAAASHAAGIPTSVRRFSERLLALHVGVLPPLHLAVDGLTSGLGIVHRLSMSTNRRIKNNLFRGSCALAAVLLALVFPHAAQQRDVSSSIRRKLSVKFTLGDALHTVHGTFQAETRGSAVRSGFGQISGEIVVDAKSGESGNGMRDRKMHKEVLESDRYPEISFRPDRVEGTVASSGQIFSEGAWDV